MHWLNSFSLKVSLPNSRLLQKYVCKGIKVSNWSYNQIIFTTSFAGQGVLDIDATVWLDGARITP